MIMRLILFSVIFYFAFCSCNPAAGDSKSTKQALGKKYFEYDAIDHYSSDFDESQMGDLFDNRSKSEIDSFRLGILLDDIPNGIADLAFVDNLAEIGYRKASVDKSKFSGIDNIFVEKSVSNILGTGCIAVFRDILVFKKNSRL